MHVHTIQKTANPAPYSTISILEKLRGGGGGFQQSCKQTRKQMFKQKKIFAAIFAVAKCQAKVKQNDFYISPVLIIS